MCTSKRTGKVLLLLLTTIAMVLVIVFNYVTSNALQFGRSIGLLNEWNSNLSWSSRGVFQNSTVTPTGWTFTVWIVIFAYQIIWLAYCWTTVCRRASDDGPPLCCEPDLAPNGLLAWHFISSLCNMAWVVLADRIDFQHILLIPQTCVLIATALSLYFALISSYYSLARAKPQLVSYDKRCDYWMTVAFVQNGISLYAGWVTIASLLNVDLTLSFIANLNQFTGSFIILSILIAVATVYVIADLTFLDRVTRFVFTPHLVIGWASAGSLVRNFSAWSVNTILTIVIACIVGCGLVLKLFAICFRSKTSPILSGGSYQMK